MKLRYSPTSPYVRKITVLALETGLDARIERVPTNPWDPESDLESQNPLGKVPALILDDGQIYVEALFICEYLDSLHDGPKLFPAPGPERWQDLRLHSLAHGVLEAAVLNVVEVLRRPEPLRWPEWMERQSGKITRTLDLIESEAPSLGEQPTIGRFSLAIALDYLDFRTPDLDWRRGRTALDAWHKAISQRPSLQATMPKEP